MKRETSRIGCACGRLQLNVEHTPIVSVACCCTSCRTAGRRLRAWPGAPSFVEADGTTPFVLYRKDRVHFAAGADLLREFRLTPESKTRRVIASCCHTPVFLEFQGGHWLSLYGCLWPPGAQPAVQMRTMTVDLPPGVVLSDDIPNGKRQPLSFILGLLGA